jgi:hypothetical protein
VAAIRVAGVRGDPCGEVRCTEVNIVAVAYLVKNDLRIASRIIAESLNIPKTVVLRILKEDLGKRKLCARFVPHSSPPEQKEDIIVKTLSRWPMQTKLFF